MQIVQPHDVQQLTKPPHADQVATIMYQTEHRAVRAVITDQMSGRQTLTGQTLIPVREATQARDAAIAQRIHVRAATPVLVRDAAVLIQDHEAVQVQAQGATGQAHIPVRVAAPVPVHAEAQAATHARAVQAVIRDQAAHHEVVQAVTLVRAVVQASAEAVQAQEAPVPHRHRPVRAVVEDADKIQHI